MDLGNKIKTRREKLGISRKELANMLNVSYSTVSIYEQGKREPNIENLNKLAIILKCDINYLIEWSNFRKIQYKEGENLDIADEILKQLELVTIRATVDGIHLDTISDDSIVKQIVPEIIGALLKKYPEEDRNNILLKSINIAEDDTYWKE